MKQMTAKVISQHYAPVMVNGVNNLLYCLEMSPVLYSVTGVVVYVNAINARSRENAGCGTHNT